MLRRLASLGSRFVATESSNSRSLSASALAERARGYFPQVEPIADPAAAVRRAHALGEPVLVVGSLYLLADLEAAETPVSGRSRTRERITRSRLRAVRSRGPRRNRLRRRVYPRQAPSLTLT